jgi:hypothetical protein
LYYNARTLCENDEISFIDYMIAKGDARYPKTTFLVERLFQTPQYQEIMEFTESAEKIRDFLHGCLKKYTEEPFTC